MIDRPTIARIMEAANIVEVVSEFVTLRKAGVNYKGLCPFHQEKTPSFVVSPSKGVCKCFSCGKGGNVIHFLMEHEQLTYVEALKWLAHKYGIEVKERELTDKERAIQNERESLFIINNWANEYFQKTLFNHPEGFSIGLTYFRNRGLRDDIIKKFQLGYSLDNREHLPSDAIKSGYREELLLKTGLCYKTDRGDLIDRYHGRVIFPINTISGKVVAFGGRILSNNKKIAKYVNSPESEIYHKSNELYGLYQAKHSIVKYDRCFLVEGYMDVISMSQSGIENVVASSGTSLTEGQIHLLHRFTDNITVLYDGDAAGIKASLRGIDMLLNDGLNIKVLLLPNGEDPDSFAQKNSSEDFIRYIEENQVDFLRFKTNILLQDAGNDPIKRAALVTDIVKSIAVIPNPIIRSVYVRDCCNLLKVEEALLVEEVNKFRRNNYIDRKKKEERDALYKNSSQTDGQEEKTQVTNEVVNSVVSTPVNKNMLEEEALLLQALLKYGEQPLGILEDEDGNDQEVCVIEYIWNELSVDDLAFKNELYQKILVEAYEHCHDENFTTKTYFMYHPETEISLLATKLCTDKYQLSTIYKKVTQNKRLEDLIPHLVADYKYSYICILLEEVLAQLKSSEIMKDEAKYFEIMKRYRDLKNVERMLAKNLGDRVITKI